MIHYTSRGAGKAIMLIHGFPTDGSTWQYITSALSAKYRLIIPDLPGAGKSPLPAFPLTVEYMAQSVLEILDKEKITKAIVAGHSMGGYTALEMAAKQPERFAGLSLIHSSAYQDSEEKKEARRKANRIIEKGRDGQRVFLLGAAPNMFATKYADNHPEKLNAFVEKGMELPGANLVAFYNAMIQREDTTSILKNANFPVQWIIGEDDHVIPKKDLLEQSALPNISDVELYDGCGHLSMEEMPERLAKDLIRFGEYCYR